MKSKWIIYEIEVLRFIVYDCYSDYSVAKKIVL